MERGYAALQVMENHLKSHQYFAAGQLTVADIALYGYTHVADRCDYDLATFRRSAPGCGGWNKRPVSSRWSGNLTPPPAIPSASPPRPRVELGSGFLFDAFS